MALANDDHDIPYLRAFPAMIDEEIGLDQLIDENDFDLPDDIEVEQPFVQEVVNDDQIVVQQLGLKVQEEQNIVQPLDLEIHDHPVLHQQPGQHGQEGQDGILQPVPEDLQMQQPAPMLAPEPGNHHLHVGMALMLEFQFAAVFRD